MVIVSIANITTINITIAIDATINMLYTFKKGKRKVTTLEFRIPELIKTYLEKNELTQREFAKITGIDAAALSRLINSNQKQIDIRTLEKLHGHIPLDYGNLVTVVEDDVPHTEPALPDTDNQRTKRNVRNRDSK